eukprot:XP_001706536.1 Hypothetical protein GL50803_5934 [Giardia lamblia ATCC 50803]
MVLNGRNKSQIGIGGSTAQRKSPGIIDKIIDMIMTRSSPIYLARMRVNPSTKASAIRTETNAAMLLHFFATCESENP